jgi:outer membrane immunogenic protein
MKKFHTVVLGLAAGAAVAFVATGADADGRRSIKDAPYEQPFSWTGFYIGVHAGGGWSDVTWEDQGGLGVSPIEHSPSGFVGGGQVGYNLQTGPWVVGIEVTYTGSDVSESARSPSGSGAIYTSDVDWMATVVGRLGYAWDRWLTYAKAGYATGEVTVSGVNAGNRFSFSENRDGWTVGVGVEYMISRNVSFGLEYNHLDFGTERHSGTSTGPVVPIALDVDTRVDTVTGRLNWKF